MLALRYVRRDLSRIAVHRDFGQVRHYLGGPEEHETFANLIGRVRRAVDAFDADNR